MCRHRSNPFPSRLLLMELENRRLPAVFVVSSLADNGANTLRQSILSANGNAGPDTINFDPSVFDTTRTITLSTGTLSITDALTMTGPGVGVTLKNTVANAHVIDVYLAPTGTKVVLENLTITGGGATSGLTAGVYATGQHVTLNNCTLTGNTASSGVGAVSVFGGTLIVQGCTISNNKGTIGGGITINNGSVLVENSAITGNTSTQNAGGGFRFAGTVGPGGLNIRNSTIANNTGVSAGGGIGLSGFAGTATIRNCTIVGNTLSTSATGGGGIGRLNGSGTIALESCIVAGNSATVGPDIASSGTVTASYCAIGNGTGFTATGTKNLAFGADLKLDALAFNGGATQTIALKTGSPCLDAGSNPSSLTVDQRGAGFARVSGTSADIGAFESQSVPPPPRVQSIVINNNAAQRSRVTSVQVVFDTLVTLPGVPESAFQLKRQSDNASVGLIASVSNVGQTIVTLTFSGALSQSGSLEDGRYTLTVLASSVSNANGQLDGNGDNIGGDNYVLVSNGTSGIFRLFGDSDGNATVDSDDFAALRAVFGVSGFPFDFDGNGVVDSDDFSQFRKRFGTSLP